MKILIEMYDSDLRLGSVATTMELANQLTDRGFQFVFCGNLRPEFIEICYANNFLTLAGTSRQFAKSQFIQYAWNVVTWIMKIKRLRPDVIIQNYTGWGQSLSCAGSLCHIPVLSRAGCTYDSRNPSNRWIAGYLAYNRFHARRLLESPLANRVFITGHPFMPSHLESHDSYENNTLSRGHVPKFLFLGQLTKRKGLTILVEAFAQMKESAHLQLIGGNWASLGYPQEIRELISNLGIENRVELHNHQTDVVKWLKQSDVFVFPSLNDTHPRVIMEAMYLGVPVISTKSGGIPEMVENGVTGILVEPNDPTSLAKALDRLAKSEELRISIGHAACIRVRESLKSTETLDRYQEIFQTVARPQSMVRN